MNIYRHAKIIFLWAKTELAKKHVLTIYFSQKISDKEVQRFLKFCMSEYIKRAKAVFVFNFFSSFTQIRHSVSHVKMLVMSLLQKY